MENKSCKLVLEKEWTGTKKDGPEYDVYNNQSMFRYNAYFGVHTVHYRDLVGQSGKIPLPMNQVIFAAIKTSWARTFVQKEPKAVVMNPWPQKFLSKLDGLKYIGIIGEDGYPLVFPAIQAQAANSHEIRFTTSVFPEYFKETRPGQRMAIYGMSLDMETVLIRGDFKGFKRRGGILTGSLAVDWVYNSMPPVAGQIYPPVELETVTQFLAGGLT